MTDSGLIVFWGKGSGGACEKTILKSYREVGRGESGMHLVVLWRCFFWRRLRRRVHWRMVESCSWEIREGREKRCGHSLKVYRTGRETPRGNPGDIGRTKRRQRRKWFSAKYYASVMRIKEFYEDNIGRSFTGILSDFARRKNEFYTF